MTESYSQQTMKNGIEKKRMKNNTIGSAENQHVLPHFWILAF